MKIAFFSVKDYDKKFFAQANEALPAEARHELTFFDARLDEHTVGFLASEPHDAVCVFVNDEVGAPVVDRLAALGVKLICLRCAGCNNVDIDRVVQTGFLSLVNVPAYSPHAVAEHALAMLMTLNRRTHKIYNRVREGNFSLEGVSAGFDLNGKTVGVLGTGRIGEAFVRIMVGLGCHVLGYDAFENPRLQRLAQETAVDGWGSFRYVSLEEAFKASDVISLHLPLTPQTRGLIGESSLAIMKPGVIIINTSRGALVDSRAVIQALKAKRIGGLGLDTYEEESRIFYEDFSEEHIADDVLIRLMTFPNVLITPHQGFYTREALQAIADTTLRSASAFSKGEQPSPSLVFKGALTAPAGSACAGSSGGRGRGGSRGDNGNAATAVGAK